MTLWSEVVPGDVVRGARDGKAWEVLRREGPDVTIQNGEKKFTFAPSGEVELIASRDEMLAAAQAAVKVVLPGSITIGTVDPDTKVWTVPKTYPEVGSLQAHLFVLHGARSTETDILAMLAEHRTWHERNKVQHAHIHDENFWKENA